MSTIAQPETDQFAVLPEPPATGRKWRRRTVLAGSGAALLACAACGSKSAAAPAATTSASTSASSSGGTALAAVADVPADAGLIVDAPSGKIVLAKADGKVVAHSAVCTHQGGTIDGAGVCPLHGSKFNVTTGAVLNGPATAPLAAVSVTESGGKVFPA